MGSSWSWRPTGPAARSTDSPGALEAGGGGDEGTLSIPYTYSVYFREDDNIEWSHRWDLYFVNQEDSRIHWLAIANSLIIYGLLTSIVMIILAKTIRTDIKGCKEVAGEEGKGRKRKPRAGTRTAGETAGAADAGTDADEALEDVTGWKLLHADVFRRPRRGRLLAPLLGSGMQLLLVAVGLVVLSALGVLNPSFRGGFVSVSVGLFVVVGLLSGYVSARILRSLDGRNDGRGCSDARANTVLTAVLVPGLAFALVLVLNLFVWAQASSTALPFTTLVAMVAPWLCVQAPLVVAGSCYGHARAGPWEHPTRTAAVARPIPQQAWYAKPALAVLLAGLIPFAVIFIELLFVFQSLWQDKSGYYVFKLHIRGLVSSMLFFAYSFMACCAYGLLTGTVGFLSAYAFVRRIYGVIKVD